MKKLFATALGFPKINKKTQPQKSSLVVLGDRRPVADMDIALREGDFDAVLAEGLVDGKMQIAGHRQPLTDIGDIGADLEIERAVAKGGEIDTWVRPQLAVGQDSWVAA